MFALWSGDQPEQVLYPRHRLEFLITQKRGRGDMHAAIAVREHKSPETSRFPDVWGKREAILFGLKAVLVDPEPLDFRVEREG